jgi:hypothetical protein
MLISVLVLTLLAQQRPSANAHRTSVGTAQTTATSACPVTIGIGKDGTLFFDRLNRWQRTTPKMVEDVLRTGCFPNFNDDARPRPISAVKLALAADAPPARTDLIFLILARHGWSRDKVNVQNWIGYPKRPPR